MFGIMERRIIKNWPLLVYFHYRTLELETSPPFTISLILNVTRKPLILSVFVPFCVPFGYLFFDPFLIR